MVFTEQTNSHLETNIGALTPDEATINRRMKSGNNCIR
jgi:hypothetical protein